MDATLPAPSPTSVGVSLWRDTIAPKEHGSWSLAFEPIALALLVAPTPAGAFLAMALAAGFFARRPARILRVERRPERRAAAFGALAGCALLALGAFGATLILAENAWLPWLVPMVAMSGVFAVFDLRGAGREEAAEIAGATAFGLAPAAFAALAGWPPLAIVALVVLVVGRAVPSVICVRAFLRAAKTGTRRDAPALVAAAAALGAAVWLSSRGLGPTIAAIAMGVFAVRAIALLLLRPSWRARTIGMIEAMLGVGFVAALAFGWNG